MKSINIVFLDISRTESYLVNYNKFIYNEESIFNLGDIKNFCLKFAQGHSYNNYIK